MKVILTPNRKPIGNLRRITWDYFNRNRPLIRGGQVKHTQLFGWVHSYKNDAGEIVRHVEHLLPGLNPEVGILTVTEDDLRTADGLSIFSNTAEEYVAWIIQGQKAAGNIPFETEVGRTECLAALSAKGVPPDRLPILPPVGLAYWIVDDSELPGGVTTSENDFNNFFDAWEWED